MRKQKEDHEHLRENKKKYLCYPEDKMKGCWDLFIALVLIFTCVLTPFFIAFLSKFDLETQNQLFTINYIIDTIFLIDIFISFISAFYDTDHVLRDDLKYIANNYLRGWFILDMLSIMPLDVMFIHKSTDLNSKRDPKE